MYNYVYMVSMSQYMYICFIMFASFMYWFNLFDIEIYLYRGEFIRIIKSIIITITWVLTSVEYITCLQ